jgi:hypothetical protein
MRLCGNLRLVLGRGLIEQLALLRDVGKEEVAGINLFEGTSTGLAVVNDTCIRDLALVNMTYL